MEARIYVGTYGKYNAGSLFGQWIDLTKCTDKETFIEACQFLHNDENDPELMFQDYDGILHDIPKSWVSESSISEEVFEFLEHFSDEEARGEAFLNWVSISGYNGDFHYLLSHFEEAYQGDYDSEKAFAEYLAEEMGWYSAMKKAGINEYYFDEEAYARDLFMSDYTYSNGVVYRNL